MIVDCTLTTACYDLNRFKNHSRSLELMINNMRSLLLVPCYLVINTDKTCYGLIKNIRDQNNLDKLTYYIIKEFEELEFYKYNEVVKKNREKYHPTNDGRNSSETHIIQSSKFNFVLDTIRLNPFNTSKFGWIDANIGENFSKICLNYKNNKLLYVLNNVTDKFHLQILNDVNNKYLLKENKKEYYEQYRWLVCGCLFTTGKDIGIKILNRLNEIFIETTELGYGHGDEMFFLEILEEFKNDIVKSYGDYKTILNNFIRPTEGLNYMDKVIVKKYIENNKYKEAYELCELILNEYENYNIELEYSDYFYSLFNYYLSTFYYKNNEVKIILNKIYKLIDENPYVRKAYESDKDFFENQFIFGK